MEQALRVGVRRARPSDGDQVCAFINRARPRGQPIALDEVLARLGTVGLLLAEVGGDLVGLLGWRAENLVARVTDFMILPAHLRLTAGRALVTAMEDAAQELQCEAVILFVPPNPPPEILEFWGVFGYGLREVANLPRPWREAAREADPTGDWVVLKQLRSDRVLRPL